MVLKPFQYYKIEPLLGKPKKGLNQGGFILSELHIKLDVYNNLQLNSKCLFSQYEKGILIYFSNNNSELAIPILHSSILHSEYKVGKSTYRMKTWTWRWILKKCFGKVVPNFLMLKLYKIKKEPNTYILKTVNLELAFTSIGDSPSKTVQFFKPIQILQDVNN